MFLIILQDGHLHICNEVDDSDLIQMAREECAMMHQGGFRPALSLLLSWNCCILMQQDAMRACAQWPHHGATLADTLMMITYLGMCTSFLHCQI